MPHAITQPHSKWTVHVVVITTYTTSLAASWHEWCIPYLTARGWVSPALNILEGHTHIAVVKLAHETSLDWTNCKLWAPLHQFDDSLYSSPKNLMKASINSNVPRYGYAHHEGRTLNAEMSQKHSLCSMYIRSRGREDIHDG